MTTTNKTTKTTKATTQQDKPVSSLPLDLIDVEIYNKLQQSGLKLQQREIVAIYLMQNKLGHSTQSKITALCESGKTGHKSIITMAQWLKTQGQDTATIKTQVNRAFTKLKTGLSLQGLGKDQTVTIAPKQNQKGGKDAQKESSEGGEVLTIQYDNDSFDQDAFDQMFTEWDKETQKYFIKHISQLVKK
jgi:hypothetical protein